MTHSFHCDLSLMWYKLYILNAYIWSVFHGGESIFYLDSRIWDILPLKLSELASVDALKNVIQERKPKRFPCRFCKKAMHAKSRIHFSYFVSFFNMFMRFLRYIVLKVSVDLFVKIFFILYGIHWLVCIFCYITTVV